MKRTINLFIATFLSVLSVYAQDIGLNTLVLDPGHGGTDPGAVSKDNKSYEKFFTLDIAKRLSDKVKAECPGVKVVLTRDNDKTIALNDRAVIANKAEAKLFMSIHINSCPKSAPNGYSVHVLGKSSNKDRDLFAYNMDVCKRENSVILLEDDYTTTYQGFDPSDPESFIFLQLMQNSHLEQSLSFAQMISESLEGGPISANRGIWQDPFLVLWKTAMPSVLVELGFISNNNDLNALKNEANRDTIATRLSAAFKKYKESYDRSVALDVEVETPAETKPNQSEEPKAAPSDTTGIRFGIQIFAGARKLDPKDKAFMGYTPVIIFTGKVYKYIIAVDGDIESVKSKLPTVRKKYPDAFIVKIEGEKASTVK